MVLVGTCTGRRDGERPDWEAPGAAVAESVSRPAAIVAYNLGTCNGQLMYQAAKWYFPGEGESFDPRGHYNICTGGYVDSD